MNFEEEKCDWLETYFEEVLFAHVYLLCVFDFSPILEIGK